MTRDKKLSSDQRKAILLDYRSAKKIAEEYDISEVYVGILRKGSDAKFLRNSLTDKEYELFEWANRIRKFIKRISKIRKDLTYEELLKMALSEYQRP